MTRPELYLRGHIAGEDEARHLLERSLLLVRRRVHLQHEGVLGHAVPRRRHLEEHLKHVRNRRRRTKQSKGIVLN